MSRTYLDSKKVSIEPDLCFGCSILNLYFERRKVPIIPKITDLYGLFLSGLPADGNLDHGNEIHLPVLFARRELAEALFEKLNSHLDIKRFQESLDVLVGS